MKTRPNNDRWKMSIVWELVKYLLQANSCQQELSYSACGPAFSVKGSLCSHCQTLYQNWPQAPVNWTKPNAVARSTTGDFVWIESISFLHDDPLGDIRTWNMKGWLKNRSCKQSSTITLAYYKNLHCSKLNIADGAQTRNFCTMIVKEVSSHLSGQQSIVHSVQRSV